MGRIKLIYIVSTLGQTGPTRQLYNLTKYLDRDIFHTTLITLSQSPIRNLDEDFFLKWGPDTQGDGFAAEADGICALRAARALTVPELIGYSAPGHDPAWILMEYIPHGKLAVDYAARLGEGLATLHRNRFESYGWERDNFIGSLPQSNGITDDWHEFWWQRRLE